MSKIENIVTLMIAIASFVAIMYFAKYMQDNPPGTVSVREQTPCEIELDKWRQKFAENPEDEYSFFRVRQLNRTCQN